MRSSVPSSRAALTLRRNRAVTVAGRDRQKDVEMALSVVCVYHANFQIIASEREARGPRLSSRLSGCARRRHHPPEFHPGTSETRRGTNAPVWEAVVKLGAAGGLGRRHRQLQPEILRFESFCCFGTRAGHFLTRHVQLFVSGGMLLGRQACTSAFSLGRFTSAPNQRV